MGRFKIWLFVIQLSRDSAVPEIQQDLSVYPTHLHISGDRQASIAAPVSSLSDDNSAVADNAVAAGQCCCPLERGDLEIPAVALVSSLKNDVFCCFELSEFMTDVI